MTNEVKEAIEIIKDYFNNEDNFKTREQKYEGTKIIDELDEIMSSFINDFIVPDVKEQAKAIFVDIGAQA